MRPAARDEDDDMSEETLRAEIIAKVRGTAWFSNPAEEPFVPSAATSTTLACMMTDMALLTDAALEFWLTHGRYKRQFETTSAK